MKQSRRDFIKVTSIASASALPAIKTLASAIATDPDHFDNLIDGDFNDALEFQLIDNNLLNLHFYFINVVKQKRCLLPGPRDRSYMIVRLPQMHISENGFWDTKDFNDPVANLSGFSYLAFELWPGLPVGKRNLPFLVDCFLDWNNSVNFELITLVEWLKIKNPIFPYFTFEEYIGPHNTTDADFHVEKGFFSAKSFTNDDIHKITHSNLPKSLIFAKYRSIIRKFFKIPVAANLPEDVEFVPVTIFEIPQGLCTVPIYRTADGKNLGPDQDEKVDKTFWPNLLANQIPKFQKSLKYEIWSNSLQLKRQAADKKGGSNSSFHFEIPGLRVVGILPEKPFVYKARGQTCLEQVADDKTTQVLPSLLDKTELAYLLQYAKIGAHDFTTKEYDLQILEGLIFTGLGTITHLSYSNRNCPYGIDLIEYEHRIIQGRDLFEKVSRLGYNSKTGQAYKHTIEGQRLIDLADLPDRKNTPVSYVHFEQYCECLDTEVSYDDEVLISGDFNEITVVPAGDLALLVFTDHFNALRLPFKYLKVKEKVRIPIDCLYHNVINRNIDDLECLNWFWPLIKNDNNFYGGVYAPGQGKLEKDIPITSYLPCDHDSKDRDGNNISADTGFMFLRKTYIESLNYDDAYTNYYKGTYLSPDQTQDALVERRRTYYNNQKIAYTPSSKDSDGKPFDSKTNQIATNFTETYFRIRKFADITTISKSRHVLFPQLLQAEVFLDHIKDLTQRSIPSYIEYHKAYLDHQFDKAGNYGAQILAHTDAFINSLSAPAGSAAATLGTYRDDLMNALQEAKDKLGNIVIPDIKPETVSLKTFGITLPKTDPGFTDVAGSVQKFLDPKRLIPGQFSEILGGIDLKQILNDLIPDTDTPVFQIAKTAVGTVTDITAEIQQSPVYQQIQTEIAAIQTEIDNLQNDYNRLVKEINDTTGEINQGLKVIANGIPNAEQVKNYINKQFEQYKIAVFDLAFETLPIAQVKGKIDNLVGDAQSFMDDQVSFVQNQIKIYQPQVADSIGQLTNLIGQLQQVDIDQLPAELISIGADKLDDYLSNNLLPLVNAAITPAALDYASTLEKIYSTITYVSQLKGVNVGTSTYNVAINYDSNTFIISATANTPIQLFDPNDLTEAGFAQLDMQLNFFRTLIVKNSNGNQFQLDAILELQNFFDKTKAGNYIQAYNDSQQTIAKFQDAQSGPVLQNITKWKNTYDAFNQTAITLGGQQTLTKIHDFVLKAFPWIDTLRKLDPYFYYQEFIRLKKDATDIAQRFQSELKSAYQTIVGDGSIIEKAANDYLNALHQLKQHPTETGNFMTSVNTITGSLDNLSLGVLKQVPGYAEAQAQILNLYGDATHIGLVKEVQTLQGNFRIATAKLNDYIRQNEGTLTEKLTDVIADFIVQHPDEVELVEEAKNIYNLLNSLQKQDLTYTWSTTGFRDVNLGIVAFKTYSSPPTQLTVNVRVTTNFTPGKFPPAVSSVDTYSENVLSNFGISVFSIFTVIFSEVSFVTGSGQSTHFAVKIRTVQFDGALAFVQTFEDYLKTLDAGLILDLEPDHVALGYSLPIPSIETPGFAFFNLTLNFDFRLYFDKRPMTLGFSLATAENKFGIAVYIFAGFGFFSIEAEPKRGIVLIDAALEAGVWAGFSLGPITGEVKLAFGFRYTKGDFGTRLEGYIVAEGRLSIWIIEVSARIYLGIISENSSCEGSCTVTYSVKLGFFKKSFSGTFYKKIAGAAANNQQQAEQLHETNMASARLLQANIKKAPAALKPHLVNLNAQLMTMQTAPFKTTFINKAVSTGATVYLPETYGVSQADWDNFFDRFN